MVEPAPIDKQKSPSIAPQSAGNFIIENASRQASLNRSQPKKSPKLENEEEEDVDSEMADDEEEEQEYDVEAIRSRRKNPKTGLYEYLVKWENYPESQNTWEPIDNLKCPDLIARFNEQENNKRKRRSTNDSSSSQQAPQSQTKRPKRATTSPEVTEDSASSTAKIRGRPKKVIEEKEEEPFLLEEDNSSDKAETLSVSSSSSNAKDKSKSPKESAEPAHQQVKGFERKLPIERIAGSVIGDDKKLWFFIKWKDLDSLELVESTELEEKAPRDLCCWYRERLYYAIEGPAPSSKKQSKSVGELASATNVS